MEGLDLVKDTINFPVKYEPIGEMILDKENNMVCQIRGWGWIQYLENPEGRQDAIGNAIADFINGLNDK